MEAAPHNGLFIVFEGGEGGGKSTQARTLQGRFESENIPVLLSREPGATSIGAELRRLLLNPATHVDQRAEALMYAADRAQHVGTVLKPALDARTVVLCDRYIDSSLVYQGMARGHGIDRIRDLSLWAADGLVPDLTIILDLNPEVGIARAFSRGNPDETKFEREAIAFHHTVREGFLSLAAAAPERYVVVDASGTAETVAAEIWTAVQPFLASARAAGKF